MKKHIVKRALALITLTIVIASVILPLFIFPANAYIEPNTWVSEERSRTIHQVVELRENSDSYFCTSFSVQGGHDYIFGYDTNWAKWTGVVHAAPGEVISVSYTAAYPTLTQQFGSEFVAKDYSGEYSTYEKISYFREKMVDDDYIAILHKNKKSNSSAGSNSGVLTLTVPSLEELEKEPGGISDTHITMSVDSYFNVTYTPDNSVEGRYSLAFEINVEIDHDNGSVVPTEPPGDITDGTTHDAHYESGEDEGTEIPTAIVVGIVGIAAAAGAGAVASGVAAGVGAGVAGGAAAGSAAAGATAGPGAGSAGATAGTGATSSSATGSGGTDTGNPDEATENEKKKKYKMYIQKDFGNALKRGGNPVIVRARIAEISANGTERDRNDLTGQISVSGSGATIHGVALVGRYCEANISVPAEHNGDAATVTFTFTGEGGCFRNTVRFRVVGTPRIEFCENEGLSLDYNGQICRMNMIEGDGLIYPLRFTVIDALSEPKPEAMHGENNGFSVKFEKEAAPFTYTAYITNNSQKKFESGFFKPSELFTHIFIKCDEEKEPISGSVYVTLVPEGLTVMCRETTDGFMTVDTNKDENAGGLDPEIRPVEFETMLAYTVDEANGKRACIADAGEYGIEFGKLSGSADYIESFRKSLRYQINTSRADEKIFAFAPLAVLPQPKEPYEIEIPITATHNGNTFEAKLPIRLYGEQPKQPTAWDKEKELLQRDLMRFGLSDNEYLHEQLRKAKSLTANELHMLRIAIITEAMEYYTREALEFNNLDQSLGRYEFTFSCVKWIMDQAFSIIAARLYGSTGEAFLTPFKDLVGQFLGDLSSSAYWGDDIKSSWSDIGQAVLKGCENTLGNKMCDAVKEGNPKKLGGVIATFLMISFIEKFYWNKDTEGDIYKSLTATFNDLAGNAVKTAFSAKFGDILKNNPGLRDTVQEYFIKDFCKRFPNPEVALGHSVKYATDSAMGLINNSIEKYVTETLGLTATIFINNLETINEKLVGKSYAASVSLDTIKANMESGAISSENAAAQTIALTYRTIGEMTSKDMFDIDIKIGDSTLRFNILDNLGAVASFLWDNTFGLLIPRDIKEEPVNDCKEYVRIL